MLTADCSNWEVIFESSVTGEGDTQAYLNKSKFEQSSYCGRETHSVMCLSAVDA